MSWLRLRMSWGKNHGDNSPFSCSRSFGEISTQRSAWLLRAIAWFGSCRHFLWRCRRESNKCDWELTGAPLNLSIYNGSRNCPHYPAAQARVEPRRERHSSFVINHEAWVQP